MLHHAKILFAKLYNRRLLVRLMGVKVSGLIAGTPQLTLFDNDAHERLMLYRAMDKIKLRFGSEKILRAINLNNNHANRS